MKAQIITLLSILMLLSSFQGFSQQKQFNEEFLEAEDYIQSNDFARAIPILQKLLEVSPNNANLNFKLGFCYLNTSYQKDKAIDHLLKARENITHNYFPDDPKEKRAPFETPFFLAQAYHHVLEFDKALELYHAFYNVIKDDAGDDFLQEVNNFIQASEVGKKLVNNPKDLEVVHFGEGINTPGVEYAPVVTGDESVLIFTSNRGGSQGEGGFSESNDDLYIITSENGEWGEPQKMSDRINSAGHEAAVSISFDGNTLFIYKNDEGDGNLYESTLGNDGWGVPVLMPKPINSKHLETHGCLSADRSTFYFASDRPGGYGGLDIYASRKLPNGKWSKPMNLGSKINTSKNEDSPFIHPDNNQLYFSSAGQKTMGGYDIFLVKRSSETDWGEPENIGYPINSTSDDVCFSVTADGKRAYYSSFNSKSFGQTDLFMLQLEEAEEGQLMVYVGYAKDNSGNIIPDAMITAFEEESGEMFGSYVPNPRTGKFVLAAKEGTRLNITIEADGYNTIDRTIVVGGEEVESVAMIQEVKFENIDMVKKWVLPKYVFFGFDDYESDSKDIEELIRFLKQFPDTELSLIGHTDSKGSDKYNEKLSKKRALDVLKQIQKEGLTIEKIKVVPMGESKPIAKNEIDGEDCPEGRKLNRRVEIYIKSTSNEGFSYKNVSIPREVQIR